MSWPEAEQQFELVELKLGIKSLRQVANREIFHPEIGPFAEAKILHVAQHQLAERCSRPGRFVIWDVGLGAAANSLCAIEELAGCKADVEIHSFDQTLAPLRFAMEHATELEYPARHQAAVAELMASGSVKVAPRLRWVLHLGDFCQVLHHAALPRPDAIFYDPYSHKTNREMWTLEHFADLRSQLGDQSPYLLTNYTASSVIRVTWLLAGLFVGVGTRVGRKAYTTVASNRLESLERPLPLAWLDRVRTSHSASPLRRAEAPLAPISPADLARLEAHPQFQPGAVRTLGAAVSF